MTLRCLPLAGYYDINQTVCVQCRTSCYSCISATYCIRCKSGYLLFNNTCSPGCPKRYFIENYTLTCQQCPIDCFYCDNISHCLDCSITGDFRTLTTSQSRCISIVGYYDDLLQVCKPCQNGCSICTSLTFCIACLKGYFLSVGYSCQTSCPTRMFP